MNRAACRSSGFRRLGAPDSDAAAAAPQQQPHSNQPGPPTHVSAAPGPARQPPQQKQPRTATDSSKAQALAAFQALVEGASGRARLPVPLPSNNQAPDIQLLRPPTASTAAAASTPDGQQQQQEHVGLAAAGANNLTAPPAAVAAAQAGRHAAPTSHHAPPPLDVSLMPAAEKALGALRQQLASRSLTYLYQFDRLLTAASAALVHVAGALKRGCSSGGVPPALEPLLPNLAPPDAADRLLQVCVLAWEATALLFKHHHAAEPANTAQHAGELHGSARSIWLAWEAVVQGMHGGDAEQHQPGGAAEAWQLTDALFEALSTMASAAAAWSGAKPPGTDAADWCYLQLRKHACAITQAADDTSLQLPTRQALHRLQLQILAGNLGLAARQGHQVVWANLVRLLRQALQGGVLEAEEVLGACLVIAGSLAEQASELLPADRSSSGAGQHTTATDEGGAAAIASRLLGFAAELVGWARQQALLLEPQQPEAHEQRAGGALPPEEPAASAVLQHVCDIEQQVLMQLARAHLACGQPGRVLDCVASLQGGLVAGRRPPPGLLQLSSLALLQQGQLSAATTQLCVWLQQGGQTTDEACSTVRAFLGARNTGAATSLAERDAAVQRVATAAAECCRLEPQVALEVVMQLLAEEAGSSSHTALEKLAVQLLGLEEVSQLLRQRHEDCQRCHALLHAKGAAHYAASSHAAAIELLTPAVFFAPSLTAGKSARLLAAALLKAGQPGRAIDYCELAEQQEQQGQPTATGCLIRLQAALLNQPAAAGTGTGGSGAMDEAVTAAVKSLARAQDFDGPVLQTAFSLCMQHGATDAAWQVLLCWHDAEGAAAGASQSLQVLSLMQAVASSGSCKGTPQQLLQLLPTCRLADMCDTFNSCAKQLQRDSSNSNKGSSAAQSAAADGQDPSTGCSCLSARQLRWLVDCGLRLGLAAARQGGAEQSLAVLLNVDAVCKALSAAEAASEECAAALHSRCMAATGVAVSLLLSQQPPAGAQAWQQAAQLLQAVQSKGLDVGQAQQLLLMKLSLVVACRQGHELQAKQQLQLLVQQPGVTPQDLLAAARECLSQALPDGSSSSSKRATGLWHAAAALAFSHALRLAAAAQPPGTAAVAEAVCGIMGLSLSHAVKQAAVARVAGMLDVLQQLQQQQPEQQDGVSFPAASLQWLVAVCWNAAVEAHNGGQPGVASGYRGLVTALAAHQQQQPQPQQEVTAGASLEAHVLQADAGSAAAGAAATGTLMKPKQGAKRLLGSEHFQRLSAQLAQQRQDTAASQQLSQQATEATQSAQGPDRQPAGEEPDRPGLSKPVVEMGAEAGPSVAAHQGSQEVPQRAADSQAASHGQLPAEVECQAGDGNADSMQAECQRQPEELGGEGQDDSVPAAALVQAPALPSAAANDASVDAPKAAAGAAVSGGADSEPAGEPSQPQQAATATPACSSGQPLDEQQSQEEALRPEVGPATDAPGEQQAALAQQGDTLAPPAFSQPCDTQEPMWVCQQPVPMMTQCCDSGDEPPGLCLVLSGGSQESE